MSNASVFVKFIQMMLRCLTGSKPSFIKLNSADNAVERAHAVETEQTKYQVKNFE